MKTALIILSVLLSTSVSADPGSMQGPVDVLSEPGKIVPNPEGIAKDCSPEEKLAIDCREVFNKIGAEYDEFKKKAIAEIDFNEYEIKKLVKGVRVPPEMAGAVAEYKQLKADKKSLKKAANKIFQLAGVSPKTDYNCLLGPDYFYLYNPKFGACSSGFTHRDPYTVEKRELVQEEDGSLSLSFCRSISYVPYSFKICGTHNLDNGAQWIDRQGAYEVTKISEYKGKEVASTTVYKFKRGKTYSIYEDAHIMIEDVVKAKHKKCVPLLPKPVY